MEVNYWYEDTKELRKDLGLPITKDLVYYEHTANGYIKHKVIRYSLYVNDGIKNSPSNNPSLYIKIEDGRIIPILCAYLKNMQSSTFEKDMEELSRSNL